MRSYEHAEAVKALRENKLDSALILQDDGSWVMSLMNPSKEISVVDLPNIDAPIMDGTCQSNHVGDFTSTRPIDHFMECQCKECSRADYPDEVCQECGEHIDHCRCGWCDQFDEDCTGCPHQEGCDEEDDDLECGEYDDTTDDSFDCGDPNCPVCGGDNK